MERAITNREPNPLFRYFFEKGNVHILGVIRMCIAFITLHLSRKRYGDWSGLTTTGDPVDLLHQPGGLIDFLSIPFPLPEEWRSIVATLFYVTGVCSILGFCTRPALVIFGLLAIYGADVEVSRGFFNHETSLTTQILLILAFVPGSTSFSIDKLLLWFYSKNKGKETRLLNFVKDQPKSVWGIKLILIILACTYVTAGVSKIRYGGIKWLDGSTLTYYLDGSASAAAGGDKIMFLGPKETTADKRWKDGFGIHSYSFGNRMENPTRVKIGKAISSNYWLMIGISVSTVVFELCGFMLLIPGWIRIVYLFGAICMHATIGALMGLPFYSYQILCLCLIDWKWLYQHLRQFRRMKMLLLRFRLSTEQKTV